MQKLIAPLFLLLLTAETTAAQTSSAAASPRTTVWSTNPLGFLQLGPNLEFERTTSARHGFGGGVRLPTLGLATHLINDGIQSGWTIYGIWHAYPRGLAPRGWYVGPHVEIGGTSNETFTSRLFGGGGEFGYRWVKTNGFSIAVGGL